MYKYEVIVFWSEEDDLYIAEVPELIGCMADGSTYEEAITNIKEAIEGWLEVMESKHPVDPSRLVEVAV